jgi:pyruvate dehydrogenase E1 component
MYGYRDDSYGENVFYYLTVYNEPVMQPAEPEGLDVSQLLKGMYRFSQYPTAAGDDVPRAQLLGSGVALPWVLKAQQILAEEYSVAADIWSVTSWNELRRDAVDAERHNLLHPGEEQVPFITRQLKDTAGPVVAVSDYMRAVPDQIARWVPGPWQSLGTDGFGFADTRAAARRTFQVDAESIVVAVLQTLAQQSKIDPAVVREAFTTLRIDDPTAVVGVAQEGTDA